MSYIPQSARIAPPEILASIAAVVDYNWNAEQADHQEQPPQDRPGHVFDALTAIRGWLDALDDLTQLHETVSTDADRHRYALTRFYRRGEHTFRVRIERDSYKMQSFAVAEVLDADRKWSNVVGNDSSNWYDSTSPWGERGTGGREPGFTTLRRLSDALAHEASVIVPA